METIEELNSRAWYRFIKLTYILSYILFASGVSLVAYSTPARTTNAIKCQSGVTFDIPDTSNIFNIFDELKAEEICKMPPPPPGFKVDWATISPRKNKMKVVEFEGVKHEFPADATDDEIRAALSATAPPRAGQPHIDFIPDPEPTKYEVITKTSYRDTWQLLGYGFFAVVVLGEIIRRSFFYVVIGKPFF